MTIILSYILQGVTLGFSAAVSPGPFQTYLLSQTMKNGWQRTLPATLAPIASDGPIIALVLFVLTQTPTWFLNLLQIIGGLFILYLAWGAYQTFKTMDTSSTLGSETARQSLLKAIFINFLNPNPYIFWSVISGPILLEGWRQSPALGLSFVGSFYGFFVGFLVLLVLIFALARKSGPTVVRAMIGLSALALLVFGCYQIASGLFGIT
jgi:threonine/homoserine/homoserine lactone efflux protein